jgi:hypothetical protein
MHVSEELRQFIAEMTRPEPAPVPPGDSPWRSGQVYQVDREAYFEWMEAFPPRWMTWFGFVFAEGSGPFRLFWKGKGERYFARDLTDEETDRFCELAGVSREQ